MAKSKSRPQRWAEACANAQAALQELVDLKAEYEDWQSNLPENLQSGALADKLDEVVNLDIESAKDLVDEAEQLDLPQGFGRD